MERIIGRIGRIGRIEKCNILILLLLTAVAGNVFAGIEKIKGTDITVSYPVSSLLDNSIVSEKQRRAEYMEFGKTYALVPDWTSIRNYENEKFIFTVSNENDIRISYDITPLVFECKFGEYIGICYPGVTFFESENGVNMIFQRDDDCCFIIEFNFEKKSAAVSSKDYLSTVLRGILCCEFGGVSGDVAYRFFKNKEIDTVKKEFFLNSDPFCVWRGGYEDGLFCMYDNYVFTQDNTQSTKDLYRRVQSSEDPFDFYDSSSFFIQNLMITAKSALRENKILYAASNMSEFSTRPWVPAIDYKEEEILIESPDYQIVGIFIGNGFFTEDKQYLYTANNRVKELEIIYDESYGIQHKVILEDSPFLQYIPLVNVNEKKIRIKILSVYSGTLYNDTCINCIYAVRKASGID